MLSVELSTINRLHGMAFATITFDPFDFVNQAFDFNEDITN
jgi:hypothetical protein